MSLFLSIAFISAATLAYEILLARLFSIIQWHHFAYMIISLALLGFGASGTFLSLSQRWILPRWRRSFQFFATLFALSIVGSFLVAQLLPFNALEIAWDWRQLGYLLAVYLILTLPFFCAGTCIGLCLSRFTLELHRLYRYDLMGAGVGAFGIIGLLWVLDPVNCLRVLSALPLLAAALIQFGRSERRALGYFWVLAALLLPLSWPQGWSQLKPSEFKGIALSLRVPDTEIIHEASSPLGLIQVVQSPRVPFRHAPGLSLKNLQEPPAQLGIFSDGDSLNVISRYQGERESLRYLDFMTSALPYHLFDRPKVLILGAGGGAGVLLAHYHEAEQIDAVELNPQIVRLLRETYREFSGGIYTAQNVKIHIGEARGLVARWQETKQFDLIEVSLLDSFGAASAGLYALNENYLYTVEALQDYLMRLEPNGFLAITRWLKVPPRDSLKLFATALEALRHNGVTDPGKRLALIRSWKTTTLLVKNGDLTADEIGSLKKFCDARAFDVAYYPGMPATDANRYNQLAAPYLYEGAIALLSRDRDQFTRDYKFNISPAHDDSPYFFHFLKWSSLPELFSLRRQGGFALLEWGYPILIASLAQALLASLIFILWPLWWFRRQALTRRGQGGVLLYFFCLGLAFLFIEMAFIQRFILFLSHPLYAIAVVLAAFLVFAGIGSGVSSRLATRCGAWGNGRVLATALAVGGIVTLSILYHFVLPWLFQSFLSLPDTLRIAITISLIAPLAFCMGMPFPLGLSIIATDRAELIPWAWGINGCASVISAILATLLAVHLGLNLVIFVALGLYILAAVTLIKLQTI